MAKSYSKKGRGQAHFSGGARQKFVTGRPRRPSLVCRHYRLPSEVK
jgi:hypothetical protein